MQRQMLKSMTLDLPFFTHQNTRGQILHCISEPPSTLLQKCVSMIYSAVFHYGLVSEFMLVISFPTDV